MEIMGIKFAGLHVPVKRRLQTLAAGAWVFTILYGNFVGFSVAIYILFFTDYWFVTTLYLIWIWCLDYNTYNKGGRPSKWVRELQWWKYLKDYYPFKAEKVAGVELDPKKNYLFCSFPHGIYASGAFVAFATEYGGLAKLFPHHSTNFVTFPFQFFSPFYRELAYSLGGCGSSAKAINWFLKYPGGGKIIALIVGGAAEAIHCRPGNNTLVLKNRKGFVKLALTSGTPLVPVFTFGETDLFDQFDISEGTLLRRFQEFVKKYTRVALVIPKGRGFFQYTFGLIPQRRPLTMIIGKPLDVQIVENPTQEDIDSLHKEFIDELIKMFDENKHKYIQNPEKAKIVIE